jgi:hypothetical protein
MEDSSSGNLISVKTFTTSVGREVKPVITNGKEGYIADLTGEPITEKISATSPHKIKIKLKLLLEHMGVSFEEETRKK